MVAATGGAGTAEDPWVGWESAATSGVPAFFRCGHFGTAGVLVYGGDHANVNGSKPGPHQTITGYARLHWRGAGMADQTTRSKLGVACGPGGGTTIAGPLRQHSKHDVAWERDSQLHPGARRTVRDRL